jgi:metabolite-proton symporter
LSYLGELPAVTGAFVFFAGSYRSSVALSSLEGFHGKIALESRNLANHKRKKRMAVNAGDSRTPTYRIPQAQGGLGRIVMASLVGTTIEFYDFYIYGTAAALVIGKTFFPSGDASTQTLNAFLTFGIAFLARPLGSILFGHFGDRIGRKSTLVASMLVMGLSTTLIGALPTYEWAGVLAPVLLCLLRFGQGIGLGGEWGGAALLATENAPKGKRAWFGMFPQLGPPIGFFLANGLFLLLLLLLNENSFKAWGWRIPFLASAVLVAIGLYLRVSINETPEFRAAMARNERVEVPLFEVLSEHWWPLIQGSLAIVVCYALFYISTVFALGYGVATRHMASTDFLELLCVAVVFMALATPISAALSDRYGARPVLLVSSAIAALSGFALPNLLGGSSTFEVLIFLSLSLGLMGLTFAPLGALLPALFPTRVRYTGASSAYNIGGILGASLAPYLAKRLQDAGGLDYVGYYVTAAAILSFLAVLSMRRTDGV